MILFLITAVKTSNPTFYNVPPHKFENMLGSVERVLKTGVEKYKEGETHCTHHVPAC
jgi:hypothetical protein